MFHKKDFGWYPSLWVHASVFAGAAAVVVIVDKAFLLGDGWIWSVVEKRIKEMEGEWWVR